MVGFLLRAAICALGLWVASQLFDGLVFATPAKLLLAAVKAGPVDEQEHDAESELLPVAY